MFYYQFVARMVRRIRDAPETGERWWRRRWVTSWRACLARCRDRCHRSRPSRRWRWQTTANRTEWIVLPLRAADAECRTHYTATRSRDGINAVDGTGNVLHTNWWGIPPPDYTPKSCHTSCANCLTSFQQWSNYRYKGAWVWYRPLILVRNMILFSTKSTLLIILLHQ